MFEGFFFGLLHQLVQWLLYPVIIALGIALAMTLWEVGQLIAERFFTLKAYRQSTTSIFESYAVKRLERNDLLARGGPILGLMGTLIPLGPGLTALGNGSLDILSTALAVAFDTTVIGLLVGLVAYGVGRVRRRWYDEVWQALDRNDNEI